MSVSSVVVVGGGPAGLALAAHLHRAGIAVALVEPRPARQLPAEYDLRTVALTPSSLDLLAPLAIDWSRWRHVDYRRVRVEDADASAQVNFDAAQMGVPRLGRLIENAVLQAALQSCVDALAIPQYEQRVVATALERGRRCLYLDQQVCLQADLVIACDGVHSPMRTLLAIESSRHDYAQSALVACVQHSGSAADLAWQRFERSYPLAMLPLPELGQGPSSNVVWSLPRHQAETLAELEAADFLDLLQRQLPPEYGRLQGLSGRALYPLVARHAQTYIAERAVLVGDAAHAIHPLAGQGLNLGFADVRVLGEELLRLHGRGLSLAEPLGLRRYERRRRPANARMQKGMEWIQLAFAEHGPGWSLLRAEGLRWLERYAGLRHPLGRQAWG